MPFRVCRFRSTCLAVLALLAAFPLAARAQLMTFDTVESGSWGMSYGTEAGQLIFSESGVDVYIHEFMHGETPLFGWLRVQESAYGFGTHQVLEMGNVCLRFDFQNLRFQPATVSLKFTDFGPSQNPENVRVNGMEMYWQDLIALDGSTIAMDVLVSAVPDPSGPGDAGTVTFEGIIWELWIGGQEFCIDDLDAAPEDTPSALTTWGAVKSLFAVSTLAH